MRESPRIRRLRNDRKALENLRSESSVLDFDSSGEPAERYHVRFYGKGLWRPEQSNGVLVREIHEVRIELGASYPRMMPELTWVSPIFHPNISASGVVCLGGYGTHWVPSLGLDELCEMLWDMIRYQNYDVESPYNREAALWTKTQTTHALPIDTRPMRDRIATPVGQVVSESPPKAVSPFPAASGAGRAPLDSSPFEASDVMIIGDDNAEDQGSEIIDAEIIESEEDQDIVFLD
jgi:ubiquitin-protein ligase